MQEITLLATAVVALLNAEIFMPRRQSSWPVVNVPMLVCVCAVPGGAR